MYTRHTELRKLDERDEYNLALKLNEDDVWRLMEIIPHRINAQQCSNNGTLDWRQAINKDGRKYRHEHFDLMKNAFRASGGTRLISQILLDEWKTSGRKEERPTLGVLLQLLVGADCWMAADFLATEILHEPKPRPLEGPAAVFGCPISEICGDVENYLNDVSDYPNTTDLERNVNGFSSMNNNRDYRTKFIFEKEVLNAKTNERDKTQTNLEDAQNISTAEMVNGLAHLPTIPPAVSTTNVNNTETKNTQNNTPMTISTNTESEGTRSILVSSYNIPPISTLMTRETSSTMSQSTNSTSSCVTPPSGTSGDVFLSEAPVPNNSILCSSDKEAEREFTNTQQMDNTNLSNQMNAIIQIPNEVLPQLSALYIDCEQTQHQHQLRQLEEVATGGSTSSSNSNSSMSHNEEINNENDLEYLPNLSLLEQNSSNNDSSLTSVTGTSGENSFETSSIQDEQEIALKTKSSLDDDADVNESVTISQDNIPCLSPLNQ